MTERYERRRIRSPNQFIHGSFRTKDIGHKGGTKLVVGRLRTGKWATQSLLIGRGEPEAKKRELRKEARYMIKLARR